MIAFGPLAILFIVVAFVAIHRLSQQIDDGAEESARADDGAVVLAWSCGGGLAVAILVALALMVMVGMLLRMA